MRSSLFGYANLFSKLDTICQSRLFYHSNNSLTRGVTSAVIDAGEKREKLVYMQCCTAAPVQGTAYNNTTSAFGDLRGTVEAMSQSKVSVLAHA